MHYVMCAAALSVHHVRARMPPFVCGGDDYLFVLFDGSSQVRAIASPASAIAAAAAAIAALLPLSHHVHALALLTHACHLCPWASQAEDCCTIRAALGGWGGAWQVVNSEVAFCHSFRFSCALYTKMLSLQLDCYYKPGLPFQSSQ
jgi:hypothetical protein